MNDHEDRTAQAAAHALHAGTPEERAALEERRRTDRALNAEIAEFEETAALLGLAVAPVTPPPSLRASVLAAVDADLAAGVAATPAAEPASEAGGGVVTPLRPWHRRPAVLGTAIAAAAALLFGGVALGVGLAPAPVEQVSALDEVLQAPDAERVTAAVDGGGEATWVWSAALERSVVLLDDLPALAAGQTYQLWYLAEDGALPANTVDGGSHRIAVDGTMPPGAGLGVTVEPAGGSPAPTSDPILVIASA